jgi:hypothetical protein
MLWTGSSGKLLSSRFQFQSTLENVRSNLYTVQFKSVTPYLRFAVPSKQRLGSNGQPDLCPGQKGHTPNHEPSSNNAIQRSKKVLVEHVDAAFAE